MINKITGRKERTELEKEIDYLLVVMNQTDRNSKEYGVLCDNLEKLYKVNSVERGYKVSPDTLLIVGANLLGILMILGYEHANVVTSKALGFVIRGRV